MPRLPRAQLDKRKTIRFTEHEINYLEYISRIEQVSANSLIRRLVREHGEELGISFYELNRLGAVAYHDQRQQLLIAEGQRREMAKKIGELNKELELYANK